MDVILTEAAECVLNHFDYAASCRFA